ncbi:MAG: hypothetical protein B6I19_08715 [Bacteroidetes bacterium 4572_114]|nr:MAG: hypothetical protein B6I19_08715 [Bacteroidetes bacterium 4572_114]
MNKFYTGLKALKEIYPPYLTLLVFIPIIIGFIIDHELSDSRYIIINLIWIPLFTIPYILLRKRIIYHFAALVFFLIGLIEISHWIILKGPVTITSILVMSNTNLQETIEFFDLKASIGLLILIPYTILFLFSLRCPPKHCPSKIKKYLIGAVLFISAIFIFENAFNGRLVRKGVPQIAKVAFSFWDKINLYREAMQEIAPRKVNANPTFTDGRQTFVLILGESCSRRHMSLYGASRKTNPKLETRDDLIVYADVVSPYSNTLNSVLSILSQSNLEHKVSFENSIDIIDVFHSAGFTSAIYLSDHGENVYDELDRVGHDYSKVLPKANVEIPFIVWLSPAYLKLNPYKTTIIKSNSNMPFVSDDLFHSIMDLNGIESKYLEEERSVFSEKFNETRQRILEDGDDYDKR